jgi:4-amino-4-deoxy-L-arabinose transferase-like glycosyltransferase
VTEKALLICIVFIAMVIALVAWIFPPNTWDSMTYHLARVVHWVQNHSLEHYPSNVLRQLYYCPFVEYIILHTLILTGGDHLANFVQFFAMIGSWIGVYTIAGLLGAERLGRLLAVFLAATIPMGILQGSSTQTDYVAAYWMICFVYCVFRWRQNCSWSNTLFAGLVLGLGWLTKGYTYVNTFPYFLAIFFKAIWPWKNSKVVMVVCVLCLGLVLNAGYFMRNWKSSENIFGKAELTATTHWSIGGGAANILRNMCSNLGTTLLPLNQTLDSFFRKITYAMDTSEQQHEFHVIAMSKDEDNAGSLLHVLLGFVTLLIWLLFFRADARLRDYVLGLFAMCFLFSLTIKWNAFISRYHVSFFILLCPWIGTIWQRLNIRGVIIGIICIFFIFAQPYLFSGNPRRLVGNKSMIKVERLGRYFVKKPYLAYDYLTAAQGVQFFKCHEVGLLIGEDTWEYPLWVLLHQGNYTFRLEHVGVDNVSNKLSYPLGDFNPCAIISNNISQEGWNGPYGRYKKVWSGVNTSVLMKEST